MDRQTTLPAAQRTAAPVTSWAGLFIIVALFFILATLHSVIVPITQGEDELAHYRYISFIAQTGRLPTNRAERQQAWYRSDWPPLYHLLVGWVVSPLDTTRPHLKDVGESPRRRLVGQIFYPRLIIYTEDANWPWQDGILAWHIGRFISILFSAAALVFTWLTARELWSLIRGHFTQTRLSANAFAALVTSLLAFTPRFLFTSAMLSDDTLLVLLSAAFLWLLLRITRGDDRWWMYALAGLVVGLSIATKYSTGLLPLVILPAALWRARQSGWRWTKTAGRILAAWIFTVLGAGWWFGWIMVHFNTIKDEGLFYGLMRPLLASGPDVTMRRIFAFLSGSEFTAPERPDAIKPGTFWDWAVYLFQTFWGVPVLERDPLFPWAYLLALAFCLAALAGLWRFWRAVDGQTRLALGLLLMTVALLFPFPVVRFFLTRNVPETGQGRHILYPAAQAIPILLVVGWLALIGNRKWGIGNRKISSFQSLISNLQSLIPILPLLLWSLWQPVYMARTYPDPLPVQTTTFNPASIPYPLKHNFGNDIQLLGYNFQPKPEQSAARLALFWRARHPVEQNYRVRVRLVDPQGQAPLTWLSHPVNGLYPTRAWDKGDVVRDTLTLPLVGLPPGPYTLQLDLLYEAEDVSLTPAPLDLLQFDLPASPPVPEPLLLADIPYRLWTDEAPARYRQTIAVSWSPAAAASPRWALLGPDGIPRVPLAVGRATAVFMVAADWPSGEYRLQLDDQPSDPVLTVANELRRFELPQPGEGYHPVDAIFATSEGHPQVKLLGYRLPTRRVASGGGLPLTLYWQSLAPVLGDYVVFDVLLDKNQQPYGGYDRLPREYYSTILWAEGEVVEDGFAVPIRPDAPPGVYNLHVGLYALVNGAPVSLPLLIDGQLSDITSVVIGPLKVGGPPPEVVARNPRPQVVLNQSFDGQITLLGYDLSECANGECVNSESRSLNPALSQSRNLAISLTLYWRADSTPDADYTTFLHLRNAAGETVAQKDSPPAAGEYPTSLWDAGEIIVDERTLPLPDLPPGEYTPVIGLYRLDTGERLPLGDGPDTELPLITVQVGSAEWGGPNDK